MANPVLIKIDKNGSKYYEGMIPCDRCNGQGGSEAWKFTGYTCYKCGGTGMVFSKWIERTPEYEAKLAERRAKRIKAQLAEDEARAERYRLEQERLNKEREERDAREKALKALSKWVGNIGEKQTFIGKYDHTAHFDTRIGWLEQTIYVHTFKDPDGNTLVWKTSSTSLPGFENGNQVEIVGTVKEHTTYKDEKQTILTRCKVKIAG